MLVFVNRKDPALPSPLGFLFHRRVLLSSAAVKVVENQRWSFWTAHFLLNCVSVRSFYRLDVPFHNFENAIQLVRADESSLYSQYRPELLNRLGKRVHNLDGIIPIQLELRRQVLNELLGLVWRDL